MLKAFFLAFILFRIASGGEIPFGVIETSQKMFPEGTVISLENFTFDDREAYAVVSGGEIHGFLVPEPPSAIPAIIKEEDEIRDALEKYYASKGYGKGDFELLDQIHKSILELRGKHKKKEAECRILLGTDRNVCEDFDSCLKACYSVTSFCQPFALGAGRPFIDEMLKFEKNSRRLEEAYQNEEVAYMNVQKNISEESMRAHLLAISQIAKAAGEASENKLFFDYSYCFSPDYSAEELRKINSSAFEAYEKAFKAHFVNLTAKAIKDRTKRGIERLEGYQFIIQREENRQKEPLINNAFFGNAQKEMNEEETGGEPNAILLAAMAAAFAFGFLATMHLASKSRILESKKEKGKK